MPLMDKKYQLPADTHSFTGYCGEKDAFLRKKGKTFYVFEMVDGFVVAKDKEDFL
jgi:hypothetical protein